ARALDQLDLIPLRSVDEGEPAAVRLHVRSVRVGEAVLRQVLLERGKAVDLERKMREIRLNLHRAAVREGTKLDGFLAFRRLQEDQLRSARRSVPANLLEPEDLAIELHRPFQVVHTVPRMQKLEGQTHSRSVAIRRRRSTAGTTWKRAGRARGRRPPGSAPAWEPGAPGRWGLLAKDHPPTFNPLRVATADTP